MKTSFVAAAALVSFASLGFASGASAQVSVPKEQDIPATPLQKGAPEDLPGERLIPGASLAVHTFNLATQPILQPILAPEGAAPAAAPMKMKKKKMMMKRHTSRKMMKKKM